MAIRLHWYTHPLMKWIQTEDWNRDPGSPSTRIRLSSQFPRRQHLPSCLVSSFLLIIRQFLVDLSFPRQYLTPVRLQHRIVTVFGQMVSLILCQGRVCCITYRYKYWKRAANLHIVWRFKGAISRYLLFCFTKLKLFSHQLNSKNKNSPVLLFKTMFRFWNCFLSLVCYNGWQGWTWIEIWKSWPSVPCLQRHQKNIMVRAKKQLCTCITLFCTFLSRCCTTATWNFLISGARFIE